MLNALVALVTLGLTFAAGAKYGRLAESWAVTDIMRLEKNAVGTYERLVEKYQHLL